MIRFFRKAPSPQADHAHRPLLDAAEIAALLQQVQALADESQHAQEVYYRHAGDFRSAYLGQGLDFEEVRPYQQGDDLRSMDWRTTARIGKPYLKIYREEHQPALHVVLDRSASMRFGTEVRLKVTQAVRIAAIFAFASMRRGTCIGGTLLQPDELTLPCAGGETGAFRLVQAAATACPPLAAEIDTSAPVWPALERLDGVLARGTRLLLISDFHDLDERNLPLLMRLASRHELVPIQVLDKVEQRMPNIGTMCFRDSTTGVTRWVDTGDRTLREIFQQNSQQRHAAQAAIFHRVGVRLIQCQTRDNPIDILMQAQA